MALKSNHSFLVIFPFLLGSSLFGVTAMGGRKTLLVDAEAPQVHGIFVVLDPNDPKIVETAKFAIDEYKKHHDVKLSFDHVVEAASTGNPQSTNYGLIVEANDVTGLKQYDFIVIVNKDGTRKVISYN